MTSPLVVSIGTTHPRNVAGLGRDAHVAAEYGMRHATAVAAISAQDEAGVHALFAVPTDVLRAQLAAIGLGGASAVRVGALGTVQNAMAAGEMLRACTAPIVFDPVMHASAGGSLYAGDALEAVRTFLERSACIVTPNIEEAEQLSGMTIHNVEEMTAAGTLLVVRGARAAFVKGGHLAGEPVDVLVTGETIQTFADTRLPQRMRGTGCTLAMALACELARGADPDAAARGARAYVRANIARS